MYSHSIDMYMYTKEKSAILFNSSQLEQYTHLGPSEHVCNGDFLPEKSLAML